MPLTAPTVRRRNRTQEGRTIRKSSRRASTSRAAGGAEAPRHETPSIAASPLRGQRDLVGRPSYSATGVTRGPPTGPTRGGRRAAQVPETPAGLLATSATAPG